MEECLKIIDATIQYSGSVCYQFYMYVPLYLSYSSRVFHLHKETKNTVKFMLVRHPFERLISAYRDKFENATQKYFYKLYGEKMIQKFRDIPQKMGSYKSKNEIEKILDAKISYLTLCKYSVPISSGNPFANPIGPTFEEFVKFVLSYPTNDDHWRPYYIQCSLCHMDYHYVMRFENLANDSTNFLRVLNLSNNISINWDNPTAKGPTNDNIGCTYFQQISKNLAFKLFKKYEHDFKLIQL
ncbi:Carbohydrate sulfotransferase 11 [Armadillidium vulgare]|nr:Carbohydrate sulfotransferase 11 [Armadillidium vulgare]